MTKTTDAPLGSLNISISMINGVWRYEVGDNASFFGGATGFVSPERAFSAALTSLESGIERSGGFYTGQKACPWVEPNGQASDGSDDE